MSEVLTMAGIITAIILSLIGIIKSPFSKFKKNKPKLYKATFTFLALVLSVGGCIFTQFYIFKDNNIINFIMLLSNTLAGVFVSYSSYEGFGIKALFQTLKDKILELFKKAPESEFKNNVEKVVEKLNENQPQEGPKKTNIDNANEAENVKIEAEKLRVKIQNLKQNLDNL